MTERLNQETKDNNDGHEVENINNNKKNQNGNGKFEPSNTNGKIERNVKWKEVDALLKLGNIKPSVQDHHILSYVSVTKLDLFRCNLSSLPLSLPQVLPNLRILFCMKNEFSEMPAVIGKCPRLEMVSFKSNRLKSINPDALNKQMKWMILTNNLLESLPNTIGKCVRLQKLMLSGNKIREIPPEIGRCQNLELVRLASNNLERAPMNLLMLPKLAWVALSDNPFLIRCATETSCENKKLIEPIPKVNQLKVFSDDTLDDPNKGKILGSGASGTTRCYTLQSGEDVAVKEYKGDITSDGNPEEERRAALLACSLGCDSLVKVFGETKKGSLVMELLKDYEVFANPPSMESCSRDVYDADAATSITFEVAVAIIGSLLESLSKLHENGLCHGDFYGHNILISKRNRRRVWLTDFGAAFFYDRSHAYGTLIELIERRAFSHLVKEIINLLEAGELGERNQLSLKCLKDFAASCEEFSFVTLTKKWSEIKSSIL